MLCFVHLDGLFSVGVTLSSECFGDLFEIGVNDVGKHSFRIWRVEEMPVSSTTYRPVLRFGTEAEAEAFREAERAEDFDYESDDGSWNLYTHDGRYIGKVEEVVERLAPIRSEIVSGGLTKEFLLGEGVYLRQRRGSQGVQVLAIRAEHTWQKL